MAHNTAFIEDVREFARDVENVDTFAGSVPRVQWNARKRRLLGHLLAARSAQTYAETGTEEVDNFITGLDMFEIEDDLDIESFAKYLYSVASWLEGAEGV